MLFGHAANSAPVVCAGATCHVLSGHQRPCRLRCRSQFPVATDRGPRCACACDAGTGAGYAARHLDETEGPSVRAAFGLWSLPVRGARRAICFPHAPPAAQRQATERQISPGSTKMRTYKNALDRSFTQRGGNHQTPAPDRSAVAGALPSPKAYLPRPCPLALVSGPGYVRYVGLSASVRLCSQKLGKRGTPTWILLIPPPLLCSKNFF